MPVPCTQGASSDALSQPQAHWEQRFVAVGMDFLGWALTIVYTYCGDRLRLISARRGTRRERATYARKR